MGTLDQQEVVELLDVLEYKEILVLGEALVQQVIPEAKEHVVFKVTQVAEETRVVVAILVLQDPKEILARLEAAVVMA